MENITTITYHTESGEITGTLSATDNTIEPNKVGLWVYGEGKAESDYVLDRVITPRPTQPTTLTGNFLENLPVPCKIIINGTEYDCNESTATLEFNQPGTYNIIVRAWPYIDKEFVYENLAF